MMFLFDLVRGPSFRVQKNETEFEVEVETATGITTETEMASDMENEMEIEGRDRDRDGERGRHLDRYTEREARHRPRKSSDAHTVRVMLTSAARKVFEFPFWARF